MRAGRSVLVAAVAVVGIVASGCAVLMPVPVHTDPPPAVTGPSAGCGTTTIGALTEYADTIWVDGAERRYALTVPSAHRPGTDDPVPLVLDFHGLLEGFAATHPFATQFSAEAEAEGFVVAFPTGSQNGVLWDVSASEDNSDLHFIDALLDKLEGTLCIDRSRVYVTGLSYGAAMTSMLMCMRSNTFAAAAPVAGMKNRCTNTERPVPFVTFHGTADPILPYDLYKDSPGEVAARYGCVSPPSATTLQPDPDPGTGGPIVRYTWDCSAVGSAAESYVIGGGGHSWPGGEFFGWVAGIVGTTATSLNATHVIWDFFSRHHL